MTKPDAATIGLNALPVGTDARVRAVDGGSRIRRRLLELGFTENAPTRCLFESPTGNPRAYAIRGAVVALRNDDARLVVLM